MGKKISIEEIKKLKDKTTAGIGLCKEALEETGGDMKKAEEYINERSDVVSRLHNVTGAKIGLCKIAFEESGNEFDKAVELIKERGWEGEITTEESDVKDGIISAYVHGTDQKTVALVEVTCITDFVSRNDDFRKFAHEIAMQVAAMRPKYISKEDVDQKIIDDFRKQFEIELVSEGKPESVWEKIMGGKMDKFFQENCLLEQKWFKDDSKTMQNLLDETIQQIGEAITIRRILVWKLGE